MHHHEQTRTADTTNFADSTNDRPLSSTCSRRTSVGANPPSLRWFGEGNQRKDSMMFQKQEPIRARSGDVIRLCLRQAWRCASLVKDLGQPHVRQ